MLEEAGLSRRLADFRPSGELRHGGTAEVRRATAPDGREVALKVARDAGATAAVLRREIATLRTLQARDPDLASWAVVPLADGEDGGLPWVALPWFPHSLQTWVEATSPALPLLVAAGLQAATALLRFQATGESPGTPRLHRDVKPANFLVRAEPGALRVVLADFGGARAEPLANRSQPTLHVTPRYGPPEQTLTRAALPDPSVDAHALAVTLYWCFTGREPDSKAQPVPYTAAGLRCLVLQGAARLSDGEAAELAALRAAPLAALVELDELTALTDADAARLTSGLEDELRRAGAPPDHAPALAAPLLHALRRALAPDPERRSGDLRGLVAALEAMVAQLAELGLAVPPVAPAAAGAAGAPAPPPAAPPADPPLAPRAAGPAPTLAAPAPAPAEPGTADAARLDPAGIALAAGLALAAIGVATWAWLHG